MNLYELGKDIQLLLHAVSALDKRFADAACETTGEKASALVPMSGTKRTYLHEYGAFRLNGNNGSCFPLEPDNDDGVAFFAQLDYKKGPSDIKVLRNGAEETVRGWVYKTTNGSSNFPQKYRFFFFAENPSDPNDVVSSYVGYSPTFDPNHPALTIFEQYRKNFTSHSNS